MSARYPRTLSPTSSSDTTQELSESGGDRRGLPVPNTCYGLCGRKATLNERAMQSSGAVWKSRWPSIVRTVSVDVERHLQEKKTEAGAQELCQRRRGPPGCPVPNSPYGINVCVDIRQDLKKNKKTEARVQELCEIRGGRPGLPVPNESPTVSVDVKQHMKKKKTRARTQELCDS